MQTPNDCRLIRSLVINLTSQIWVSWFDIAAFIAKSFCIGEYNLRGLDRGAGEACWDLDTTIL